MNYQIYSTRKILPWKWHRATSSSELLFDSCQKEYCRLKTPFNVFANVHVSDSMILFVFIYSTFSHELEMLVPALPKNCRFSFVIAILRSFLIIMLSEGQNAVQLSDTNNKMPLGSLAQHSTLQQSPSLRRVHINPLSTVQSDEI